MPDEKIFQPKPGQTDYTNTRWAPVVSCIVKHNGKILVVKRSSEVNVYPGKWNGIGGYLDDKKNLEEKVKEELFEETGIGEGEIKSVKLGEIFDGDDPEIGKTWVIHPVLVEVETDKISLDWEAEEYRWIDPQEAENLDTTPGFKKIVKDFFHLSEN